ncbi:NEAT domain-containing protein OS=Lysinibacillus sphaericus OX=1421 GN=LS41612_19165 PE=4 SV=1 [Lysinibacillus sphaericus]
MASALKQAKWSVAQEDKSESAKVEIEQNTEIAESVPEKEWSIDYILYVDEKKNHRL